MAQKLEVHVRGEEKQGYLTKEGSEKTMLKGFFENNDRNKDGKITRDEWHKNLKFMSGAKKNRDTCPRRGARRQCSRASLKITIGTRMGRSPATNGTKT